MPSDSKEEEPFNFHDRSPTHFTATPRTKRYHPEIPCATSQRPSRGPCSSLCPASSSVDLPIDQSASIPIDPPARRRASRATPPRKFESRAPQDISPRQSRDIWHHRWHARPQWTECDASMDQSHWDRTKIDGTGMGKMGRGSC